MVEQEKLGKAAQQPGVQHQPFARQAEDAQRIAHIILYVARRAQHLVYERVERDLERNRALSEQASEGFVGTFKLG